MTEVSNVAVAVLNDVHRVMTRAEVGWVIDISAVLLTLVSLTGLAIFWFIYQRRTSGLIIAGIGSAVALLLYTICVP